MTDQPYSSRIPAAIAKAEAHVNGSNHKDELWRCEWNINKNEVALAKALWGLACAYTWDANGTQRIDNCGMCERCAALITFCEKVEGL